MGKGKKKNWFIRFLKKAFIIIISGIVGFSISFFFPDGFETLNYYGWFSFSTFQFDFQNFNIDYTIFQNSTQPLGIHHNYKTKSYPKLLISSDNPEINISCIHRDTGQKCEKSFPIDDYGYTQVDVNIKIGFTNENISNLYFEVKENKNNKKEALKIKIKK